MSRPPKNLIEEIYARTRSFRDTAKVQQLLMAWASCMVDRNTDDLQLEEFIVWASDGLQSRSTTKRQINIFRAAYPDDHVPNRVCLESGLRDEMRPLVEAGHDFKDRKRGKGQKASPRSLTA